MNPQHINPIFFNFQRLVDLFIIISLLVISPGTLFGEDQEEEAKKWFTTCLEKLLTNPCSARLYCNSALDILPSDPALQWTAEFAKEACKTSKITAKKSTPKAVDTGPVKLPSVRQISVRLVDTEKKEEVGDCKPPSEEETTDCSSLTRKEIFNTIGPKAKPFQVCYEAALFINPELKGELVIGFIVDKTGLISKSEIISRTLENPRMETCLSEALGKIVFPEPREGAVMVTYPLFFQPENLPNK